MSPSYETTRVNIWRGRFFDTPYPRNPTHSGIRTKPPINTNEESLKTKQKKWVKQSPELFASLKEKNVDQRA